MLILKFVLDTGLNVTISDSIGIGDSLTNLVNYSNFISDGMAANDTLSNLITYVVVCLDSVGIKGTFKTKDICTSWRGVTKIPRFGYGGAPYGDVKSYGDGQLADVDYYQVEIERRSDNVVLNTIDIDIDDLENPDKSYVYPTNINISDNTNYLLDINFNVYQVNNYGIKSLVKTANFFYSNICHEFIPTEIDDCVFWVDACQEDRYDREVITTWNELTGLTPNLTKFVTATADFQYWENRINELPSMVCVPGAALSSVVGLHGTASSTVFYMARMIGPVYGNIITGADDGPHRYGDKTLGYWNDTYDDCRHDDRVAYTVNAGTLPCDSKWRLHALRVYFVDGVGITWYFYINGVYIASKLMSNAQGFYRINVGGCSDSRTYSNCEISEIVAYNRLLDLEELRDLNLYFRNKYGLEEISETVPLL
jgi:hypothetical protein